MADIKLSEMLYRIDLKEQQIKEKRKEERKVKKGLVDKVKEIDNSFEVEEIEASENNELFGKRIKPLRLLNISTPDFGFEGQVKVPGATRRDKLAQLLAFIDYVEHVRYKDGCTILPISSSSEVMVNIYGTQRSASRAIKFMKEIGLIKDFIEDYQFNAYYEEDNTCKIYLYFAENERKLKEYCKKYNIIKFNIINNKYTIADTFSPSITSFNFAPEDVYFSPSLELLKPEGMKPSEFKLYLLKCLYNNYPKLSHYQQMCDDLNQKYYIYAPEFRLRFEPSFEWSKKNGRTYVVGIGIRCSNSLCNKKTAERERLLKEYYHFDYWKDVRSSVPRITLSLNLGHWVDEEIDIYELIHNEFEPDEPFDKNRELIKDFHMRAYFTDSVDDLKKNIWFYMDQTGLNYEDMHNTIERFKKALLKAEGGRTYGSEVFYVESCVYLDVLKLLLDTYHDTWLLYDAFYSDGAGGPDTEIVGWQTYEEFVSAWIKIYFEKFIVDFVPHTK